MKKPGRGRAFVDPRKTQADALAAGAFAFFAECFLAFLAGALSDFIDESPFDMEPLAAGVVEGVVVLALAPKATAETSTAAIRFLIMVGFFLQERG